MHVLLLLDDPPTYHELVNPQGAWLADHPWAIILLALGGLIAGPFVGMALISLLTAPFSGSGASSSKRSSASYSARLQGGPSHGATVRPSAGSFEYRTSSGARYVRTGGVSSGHPVYSWDDPTSRG